MNAAVNRADLVNTYRPFTLLKTERRSPERHANLRAAALAIHGIRQGRRIQVQAHQDPWDFDGEQRATVSIDVFERSGDLAERLILLTAGEGAEAVMAALRDTKPARAA